VTRTNKPGLLGTVLFLSLLLNLLCAFFVGRRLLINSAATAYVPPPKPPYYLDRDKLFEAMPADSNAIVFLGNSLTQYFELAEFFPGIHVKNRGIHGDMLEKVLLRLSPIIASKPKKIFIEMGVNDLEQKVPKEKILELYDRLLDTLKSTCPSTKLYVQSLLPVADTSVYLPYSYCSPQMNKNIVFMNKQLRWLAGRKACTFINLYDKFLLNNQLNPVYSVDGVHLSGEGYVLWTKILQPYVNE
jgi:lysophospholipase L1-like esterase